VTSVDETVPRGLQGTAAPFELHTAFDPKTVRKWEPSRFKMVRKLQDATRNRGVVYLMNDISLGRPVAVKQMPNWWMRRSHSDFLTEHPSETELPWQDIGCMEFLNSMDFPSASALLGVYRDEEYTYVITAFATEGDLFSWCESGVVAPGVEREVLVQPLARQMMTALQQLHDFSIVHRDLSLENILVSKSDDDSLHIRIIDFSMASTSRRFIKCVRGKASYQAPELHTDEEYDAFLADTFALGVAIFDILMKDYPWLSTRPGVCHCFDYVRKHGFRSYLVKRKLRHSNSRCADVISEPVKQLLEGMLAFDPKQRLTLGEGAYSSRRRSVWDEQWTQ